MERAHPTAEEDARAQTLDGIVGGVDLVEEEEVDAGRDRGEQKQNGQVAALMERVPARAEGAVELLTSYVPETGGPAGFYERLGFVPTGDVDGDGEVIMRLALT